MMRIYIHYFDILKIDKNNTNLGEVIYNVGNVPVYKPWLFLTNKDAEEITQYFEGSNKYSVSVDSERMGVTIKSDENETRMGSQVIRRLFESGEIEKEFPLK